MSNFSSHASLVFGISSNKENKQTIAKMCQLLQRDCGHEEDYERCTTNTDPGSPLKDCPHPATEPVRVKGVCPACKDQGRKEIREMESLDRQSEHYNHMAHIWHFFARNCEKDKKHKNAQDAWERRDEHAWRATEVQKSFENLTNSAAYRYASQAKNVANREAKGKDEEAEEVDEEVERPESRSSGGWSTDCVANLVIADNDKQQEQQDQHE